MGSVYSNSTINNQKPEGVNLNNNMSKTTITCTKQVDYESVINVPYYCRSLHGVYVYCIYDSKTAIEVSSFGIRKCSANLALFGGHEKISEIEFKQRHEEAVQTILSNFTTATMQSYDALPVIESNGTEAQT